MRKLNASFLVGFIFFLGACSESSSMELIEEVIQNDISVVENETDFNVDTDEVEEYIDIVDTQSYSYKTFCMPDDFYCVEYRSDFSIGRKDGMGFGQDFVSRDGRAYVTTYINYSPQYEELERIRVSEMNHITHIEQNSMLENAIVIAGTYENLQGQDTYVYHKAVYREHDFYDGEEAESVLHWILTCPAQDKARYRDFCDVIYNTLN